MIQAIVEAWLVSCAATLTLLDSLSPEQWEALYPHNTRDLQAYEGSIGKERAFALAALVEEALQARRVLENFIVHFVRRA